MALIYVTGSAGAGKSDACLELRKRGHEAYDTDDDGLARWVNKDTGYVHPKSSIKEHHRTPEFIEQHEWLVPRADIEALAREASRKTIFLCGIIGREREVSGLFGGTIALVIDGDTTTERLINRDKPNSWGKQSHERGKTLAGLETAIADYRKYGYTIIDATQPLVTVVDQIEVTAQEFEVE